MNNKFHAGTEYTNDQRDQLDAAFQLWLDFEAVNEYHDYSHEPAYDDAAQAHSTYLSMKAKFAASNATPAPYAETIVENFRRQAREGVKYDADNGRELVEQERSQY